MRRRTALGTTQLRAQSPTGFSGSATPMNVQNSQLCNDRVNVDDPGAVAQVVINLLLC